MAALLLAGCGASPAPAPVAEEGAPKPVDEGVVMRDVEMFLFDAGVTGEQRKPALSIRAKQFVQEDDKVWRFEQAQAIARQDNAEAEDIVFDAAQGSLREEESAYMDGGVKATIGTMTIDMDNVTWGPEGDAGASTARSDSPVHLLDPAMDLYAEQFRLYPDARQFSLIDVRGRFDFPQAEPETAAGGETATTEGVSS
ncbi:MAG: hypothetical protein GC168_20370 [Candidatus Hydrogenedens sp.]|nr:hypothetical protein [Candidatus Hydrogenedens sp.]